MAWKCPPLHLTNWNNFWKWKEQMNANELANLLETDCWYKLITREEIATMLRKQHEEIEYWKRMFDKAMEAQEK